MMGKVSDLFGRRRIFLACLAVSFVASLLAPLSPNFGWLIAACVMQSIGTSMLVAVGMAIVRIHISENQLAEFNRRYSISNTNLFTFDGKQGFDLSTQDFAPAVRFM